MVTKVCPVAWIFANPWMRARRCETREKIRGVSA